MAIDQGFTVHVVWSNQGLLIRPRNEGESFVRIETKDSLSAEVIVNHDELRQALLFSERAWRESNHD